MVTEYGLPEQFGRKLLIFFIFIKRHQVFVRIILSLEFFNGFDHHRACKVEVVIPINALFLKLVKHQFVVDQYFAKKILTKPLVVFKIVSFGVDVANV